MQRIGLLGACALISSLALAKPLIKIGLNKPSGFYKQGDEIIWTISTVDVEPADAKNGTYTLERGGLEMIKKGAIDLSKPTEIRAKLGKPGSFLLTAYVKISGQRQPLRQRCGVIIDRDRLRPSSPQPKDFGAFWRAKLADQERVPMNAKLAPEPKKRPNVDSWVITMDTINGQRIHGRLAKRTGPDKFPALLIAQWAGVYGLDQNWALSRANQGWLTLNLMAHDIPVNRDKQYYNELKRGRLKNYTAIGSTDREKSYFLRMALACSRAVDYLSQHPNWDGKTIAVMGTSQGGYQAIVAASLNKKVTAIVAVVPAGCDHTAPLAGRAMGWPYWLKGDEKSMAKIRTSQYFDAVNFARNVRCPALIFAGLGDPTSRAEGVVLAASLMRGPVETHFTPTADHYGPHPMLKKRQGAWLRALRTGSMPVEK